MTCIAAVRNKRGKVFVGADRRVTYGSTEEIERKATSKVIKRDGLILAGAGDLYVIDLIVHHLSIPDINTSTDTYIFEKLYTHMIRFLKRKRLDTFRSSNKDDGIDAQCLVVLNSRLFEFEIVPYEEYLLKVSEVEAPYAGGSGRLPALSILKFCDKHNLLKPKEKLIQAIEMASSLIASCGDGLDIVSED